MTLASFLFIAFIICSRTELSQNILFKLRYESWDKTKINYHIEWLFVSQEFRFIVFQDWLYKQILCSSKPLHPLLVNLIDVFVTSVVMPLPSKLRRLAANVTVQGFSEADILTVFQNQVAGTGA